MDRPKLSGIHGIGTMEYRAPLRVFTQYMAHWMLNGMATATDIDAALKRIAAKVPH